MSNLTPSQQRAIDPRTSVWVTASAGSGKTKVLTDRLLTLLLSGTPLDRILCLTFTKAAAAEMATRLLQRLSNWVVSEDEGLEKDLDNLNVPSDNAHKQKARRLFSQLLDTPGSMKIQTIHGFCQSLLSRFPLEAGVPVYFSVLDDASSHTLLRYAQDSLLQESLQDTPEGAHLKKALGVVGEVFSETFLADLLAQATLDWGRRGMGQDPDPSPYHPHPPHPSKPLDALHKSLERALCKFFHQPADASVDILSAQSPHATLHTLSSLEVGRVVDGLAQGTAADQAKGERLSTILNDWPAHLEDYVSFFVTDAGGARKHLISSKLASNRPDIQALLRAAQEHVLTWAEGEKSRQACLLSLALARLVAGVRQRYTALKHQRAALDYDDLIHATVRLLQTEQGTSWVLYKLDSGLDHLLVDEAQDTNPDQWDVIKALTDAFFEAEDTHKTLFVVGDPKQSIYSFQGADPQAFSFMESHTQRHAQGLQRPFTTVLLSQSFRASPMILEAIDGVFAVPAFLKGVSHTPPTHTAFHTTLPGLVEVWPVLSVPPAPHTLPEDALRLGSALAPLPETLVAREIARRIHGWLKTGMTLAGGRLKPSDILILVRRRGRLMGALVKALKEVQVPVAGVDRLDLHAGLAVKDLLALAQAVLLPTDDLTLATVLKGPLVGLSEDALFALAHERGRSSLWRRLRDWGSKGASTALGRGYGDAYHRAFSFLQDVRETAGSVSPFNFFGKILLQQNGQHTLSQKLGLDAGEMVDEFLALSLAYEKTHTPSLQGFVAWLSCQRGDIKRSSEASARDEVRLMTVHGSKGLESPVVILPDTTVPPQDLGSVLWAPSSEGMIPCLNRPDPLAPESLKHLKSLERTSQQDEYNRLLYVALTRAKEQLYVCGWQQGRGELAANSWYAGIRDALHRHPEVTQFEFVSHHPDWSGEGIRLSGHPVSSDPVSGDPSSDGSLAAHPASDLEESCPPPPLSNAPVLPHCADETTSQAGKDLQGPLPSWVFTRPAQEQTPSTQTVTAPHAASRTPPFLTHLSGTESCAALRGQWTHDLLETVLPLPPVQRMTAAREWLKMKGFVPEACEILETVRGLLDAPHLAWVWDEAGMSEVALMGWVDGAFYTGRVDRLIVRAHDVVIVDFKTDALPKGEIPPDYQRQLQLYSRLAEEIYALPVTCAILWTVTGQMTWVEGS